jgi:uncharacterized membrane protein YdbT with pleckstrin-like domain
LRGDTLDTSRKERRLASYVESIVGEGEEVLYVGKVSLFSILPAIIGGGLLVLLGLAASVAAGPLGIVLIALGALALAVGFIKRASTELAVTNRRVIAKFGLVRRSTVELNLSKIESIRVEQTVMGRVLNYGSIFVTGTGSTMEPIPYIANPIGFRQAVQAATDSIQRAPVVK